LIITKFILI